jgi:hypothetical protein
MIKIVRKIDRDIESGYSAKQMVAKLKMSVKATEKGFNFNSIGNDEPMLDAQSSKNLNYGL